MQSASLRLLGRSSEGFPRFHSALVGLYGLRGFFYPRAALAMLVLLAVYVIALLMEAKAGASRQSIASDRGCRVRLIDSLILLAIPALRKGHSVNMRMQPFQAQLEKRFKPDVHSIGRSVQSRMLVC